MSAPKIKMSTPMVKKQEELVQCQTQLQQLLNAHSQLQTSHEVLQQAHNVFLQKTQTLQQSYNLLQLEHKNLMLKFNELTQQNKNYSLTLQDREIKIKQKEDLENQMHLQLLKEEENKKKKGMIEGRQTQNVRFLEKELDTYKEEQERILALLSNKETEVKIGQKKIISLEKIVKEMESRINREKDKPLIRGTSAGLKRKDDQDKVKDMEVLIKQRDTQIKKLQQDKFDLISRLKNK